MNSDESEENDSTPRLFGAEVGVSRGRIEENPLVKAYGKFPVKRGQPDQKCINCGHLFMKQVGKAKVARCALRDNSYGTRAASNHNLFWQACAKFIAKATGQKAR